MSAPPPDTGSAVASAQDIAEWRALIREERDFREETSTTLGLIKGLMQGANQRFDDHERHDKERFEALDRRFGEVNQSIGEGSKTLQYVLGAAAGIVAIVGLAATIWSLVK
jgi:rhamnogalacturonyl hydrolase YesR